MTLYEANQTKKRELNMPQSTLGNMLRKAGIYISKMNKAVPHEN